MKPTYYALAIVSALVAGPALAGGHASGDAAAGEKSFKKCKTCHMIQDADGNMIVKGSKTGPNLYGIDTRPAASVDGFKYGKSLKAYGETGAMWDEETFVAWTLNSTNFLKEKLDDSKARSKMTYKLKKEDEARNIWAYVVSLTQ